MSGYLPDRHDMLANRLAVFLALEGLVLTAPLVEAVIGKGSIQPYLLIWPLTALVAWVLAHRLIRRLLPSWLHDEIRVEEDRLVVGVPDERTRAISFSDIDHIQQHGSILDLQTRQGSVRILLSVYLHGEELVQVLKSRIHSYQTVPAGFWEKAIRGDALHFVLLYPCLVLANVLLLYWMRRWLS